MNPKFFLSYINLHLCESYTLVGKINDEYVDIDLSKRFFDIPLDIKLDSQNTIDIDLKVNYNHQNDSFKAIPMLIWRTRGESPGKFIFHNLLRYNWFIENGITFLGSNSKLKLSLDIDHKTDEKTGHSMCINNKIMLNGFTLCRNNLEYIPNSWFVCYMTSKRGGKVNYRIHKNCFLPPINSQNRFNHITIGEKTIQLSKVLFYRKVENVWDYANCIKMTHAISSVTSYHHNLN